MGYFIIFIILGIIISMFVGSKVIGFLLSGLAMTVIIPIILFSMTRYETEYILSDTQDIYSLSYGATQSYTGSYFLLMGSFSEEGSSEYRYIIEEDLGYVVKVVDMEDASIVMSDEKPILNVYKGVYTEEDFISRLFFVRKGEYTGENKYQFVIPEGSVKEVYEVDITK